MTLKLEFYILGRTKDIVQNERIKSDLSVIKVN
jgi:hypothetical protein